VLPRLKVPWWRWYEAVDVSFTPVLPTPVVCSATDQFSLSLLALVVVEAGTSCRSSVVALEKWDADASGWVAPVGGNQAMGVALDALLRSSPHLRALSSLLNRPLVEDSCRAVHRWYLLYSLPQSVDTIVVAATDNF
jgi:hypothetical protein